MNTCRSGADDAAALPSGVLKGLEPATAILAQTAHAVRVLGLHRARIWDEGWGDTKHGERRRQKWKQGA
eukprot:1143908-Pelagomonas_calceolata.AAC.5